MKKQFTLIVLVLSILLFVGCTVAINPRPCVKETNETKLAVNLVDFIKTAVDEDSHESRVLNDYEKANIIVDLGDGLAQYYLSESDYKTVRELAVSEQGKRLTEEMKAVQNDVLSCMDSLAIDYEVSYFYTTMFNGFSVKTYFSNIDKIKNISGVKGAYIAQEWERPKEVAEVGKLFARTGLFNNPTGYDGEGMTVAILDSSFEVSHEAFSVMPDKVALTQEDVASVFDESYYLNAKIPFAYDYADDDPWVMPDDRDSDAYHGTHVAGIAVGDSSTISSAARKAQLIAMKVFPDYSQNCSFDTVLAALGDALLLGVDAVNLSLGSAGGFVYQRDPSSVAAGIDACFDLLNKCGTILCVASGNDNLSSYVLNDAQTGYVCTSLTSNPDNGIVATPASMRGAFSVGSVDNSESIAVSVDGKEISLTNSVSAADSLPYDFFAFMEGTKAQFEFVVIPGTGLDSDYEGIDAEGKIAVVSRGDISFSEKAVNAEKHGAIALIVYNNAEGVIRAQITEDTIPVATVTLNDSKAFLNAEEKTVVCDRNLTKYTVSYFSSSGALEDLSLGVDIMGIGGNVYSADDYAHGWGKYHTLSGTSMASPNVAAAVLAVKQYAKERFARKTNYELLAFTQQMLMSTARIVTDENGVVVSPRVQGAGLADLTSAIESDAYLSVTGTDRTKLNLGSDLNKDGIYTLRFNVHNIGDKDLSYDVSTIVLTELAKDGYMTDTDTELGHNFTLSAQNAVVDGNVITVEAGATASLKVVITIDQSARAYMDETFENGIYVEGFAVLRSLDENVDLSIPFIAFYGDWNQAPIFEPSDFDTSRPVQNVANQILSGHGNVPGVSWNMKNENYATLAYDDGILYVMFGILRNCSTFGFKIYDKDTEEVLLSDETVNFRKCYSYYGQQFIVSQIRLALGVSDVDSWLHNDSMVFEIYATFNDSEKVETVSLPFGFDFEKPQIMSATQVEEDGKTYLDLSIYDNTAPWTLAGFTLNEEGKKTYINDNSYYEVIEELPVVNGVYKDGYVNTFRLDVTSYTDKIGEDGNALYLTLRDWAWNETSVRIDFDGNVEDDENSVNFIKENVSDSETYTEIFTYNSNDDLSDGKVVIMSDSNEDFVIVNGELSAYNGAGGDVVVPDGVTSIGANVFSNRSDITSVTLPEGLTSIGNNNFFVMTELRKIVLPSTLTTIGTKTFTSLKSLEEINLEDTKITYYKDCFKGLGAPENFVIPDPGEEIVMDSSFWYLLNNKTFTVKAAVSDLNNSLYALADTVTLNFEKDIKESQVKSGVSVRGCKKIEVINFYGKVGVFGYQERTDFMFQTFSFGPMDSLKEVNFYKDVDQINGSSFCNCYKLEKVSFGGNVNYIGPGVFGSSKIQSYTVMEGNTALTVDSETGAMYNADKTRMFLPPAWDYEGEFVVPETVELTVGQFASAPYTCLNDGYNCGFNKNGTYYVSFMFAVGEAKEYKYKTTSIVLPENATVIPETCFYGLKGLQKINNVDKIERIDLGAFNFCGIEELVFTESLKQVGISPFKGMEKLKTLVLPDNLTFDRTYDFMKGCSALEEFTIPSGMNIIYATNMLNGAESLRKLTYHGTSTVIPSYMVYGGKSLETLEGFENVKTIESWAFAFSGLKEANFPSVTVVGNAAFGGCTQLERYTFNENITSMGTNAFADAQSLKEIYIGAKLRLDFSKVFLNLLSLETITVAEGNANYTSLDGALYNKALTTIIKYPTANKNVEYTVPETVTEIGAQVFIGVQKLEKITMNGVYVIGDYAFSQSGIKEVVAENLVKVGVEAFKDTALTQIDLRKVYYVDDDAFNGTQLREIELDAFSVYGKHVFANIDTLEKVVLGDVDAFPFWASFYNSNNIKEIVIKDDCKTFAMENDYFMSADRKQIYRYFGNEEVIVIPENVAKIDAQAFINNLSVKEVVLPSTLKLIGAAAFYKCDNLEKVTFRSVNAPRLEADYTEEYSLINCNFIDYVENMASKLTVYVPEINDSYNTYLWNMYFNVLVAD